MTDICTTCKNEGLGFSEYPCNLCLNRTDDKYWEAKDVDAQV